MSALIIETIGAVIRRSGQRRCGTAGTAEAATALEQRRRSRLHRAEPVQAPTSWDKHPYDSLSAGECGTVPGRMGDVA